MKEIEYNSGIAFAIKMFVSQKQAAGYPYLSSARILKQFDQMIAREFTDTNCITKEMCDRWLRLKPDEHPNGLLRRVTPVRQLAKYMNGIEIPSYVLPGHIPNRQIRYEAHIYTQKELMAFFRSVDSCPKSPFSPLRCYVIPVLFRLLFCCGLRSSEVRLLRHVDVDLSEGRFTIRASKGWKARIVYVSRDLLAVLNEYDTLIQTLLPGRTPFFPNQKGGFYNRSTIDTWFHEFWDLLPEAISYTGNPPRVHDFRHSFCVYRLNQWVQEGKNVNALYAYLSEYLGHSHYSDTDYYLSLVPSFYTEMYRRMAPVNEEILPEVLCDEE
jgi:integrase